VSTGFSDEELKQLPQTLKKWEVAERPARVVSKMEPNQWFEPGLVLEVQGAELTKSPIHTCGADDSNSSGIALRFPRFKRFREDKEPEETTTVEEIKAMYQK